jgi:hypothetical protein
MFLRGRYYYPDDGNSAFLRNQPDKRHTPEVAQFVACLLLISCILFDNPPTPSTSHSMCEEVLQAAFRGADGELRAGLR